MKRPELHGVGTTLTQLPETVLHACFRCGAAAGEAN